MTSAGDYDVAIVGGGPAGLSAAVLLGRCRRGVIVFDQGKARNKVAHAINGYLGLEAIAPQELRAAGRKQAERYDVTFYDAEVIDVEIIEGQQHGFRLTVANRNVFRARKLLLATGVTDKLPKIEGIEDFYGKSVHHCPYCDGWEHRNQRLVAIGDGKSAAELALSLLVWSNKVTACSNGSTWPEEVRNKLRTAGIDHRTEPIERLEGENGRLERLVFNNGTALGCDALFFSDTQYQRSDLARRLGCRSDSNGQVKSREKHKTNTPGLFVAGDADGYIQFAIVAAAEGAIAATAINKELQDADFDRVIREECHFSSVN
jgi:thioredoxin reductase